MERGKEAPRGGIGGTDLDWTPPTDLGGVAVAYDTIRSDDPSDFVTTAVCVESDDGTDTSSFDAATPGVGAANYYLIRAENQCPSGQGSLGNSSDGTPRTGRTCP